MRSASRQASALALVTLALSLTAHAGELRLLLQSSPLAGFRYHAASALWPQLREGDELVLAREPDNVHDRRAIRVEWRGHLLGYVPRAENEALAWALDRGERVSARIARIAPHPNPRKRVLIDVYAE